MTSAPAALRVLALASTARVADSSMAAMRRDIRVAVSGTNAIVARHEPFVTRNPRYPPPGRPATGRRPLRLRPLQGAARRAGRAGRHRSAPHGYPPPQG